MAHKHKRAHFAKQRPYYENDIKTRKIKMIDIKNHVKNRSLQKIQQHTNYKACVFDLDHELDVRHCIFENCSFRTPTFFLSLDFCEFHHCNFVHLTVNIRLGKNTSFRGGYIETFSTVEKYASSIILYEHKLLFSSAKAKNVHVQTNSVPYSSLYNFPEMQMLKIYNSILFTDYMLHSAPRSLRRNHLPPGCSPLVNICMFSKLQFLDISNNRVEKLPTTIDSLPQLQELNVGCNSLEEIPPQIGNLTNLHTLSLYNNQIFELVPQIGNLCDLQNLNLRYNTLEKLPNEIGKLQLLTFLDISENQIACLPEQIGDLTNLRTFYARENNLQTLPHTIENWQNITHIDLYHNKIQELPSQLCHLHNLSTLNLEGNPISDMPYDIHHLHNLRYLNLVNTNLNKQKVQQLRKQLPDCDVFC